MDKEKEIEMAFNIMDLSEQQVFKSYNELVKKLGLSAYKGSQRISQQKTIRRYLDFEKTGKGNEIIITQIFKYPKPDNDGRKNRSFDFQKEFDILLYYFLSHQEQLCYLGSKTNFYYEFDCFTQRIKTSFREDYLRANNRKYTGKALEIFKQYVRDICGKKVYDRLKSYDRKGLVELKKAYRVSYLSSPIDWFVFYEGTPFCEKIQKAEQKVAESFGLKNKAAVFNSHKVTPEEYYSKLNSFLFLKMHINKVCPCIEVSLQKLHVEYTEDDYLDALYLWQFFILDSVSRRLESTVKNRDEKIKSAVNEYLSRCSDDVRALVSASDFNSREDYALGSDTITGEIYREIEKIKLFTITDEEYSDIKEILSAWEHDIKDQWTIPEEITDGQQEI